MRVFRSQGCDAQGARDGHLPRLPCHAPGGEDLIRWRLATSPSFSGYYEQALAGARFDSFRGDGHLTAPTLVIHSADDRYVPVGNAALADAIPDFRLAVLRDAGHLVCIERAWEVNREVPSLLGSR